VRTRLWRCPSARRTSRRGLRAADRLGGAQVPGRPGGRSDRPEAPLRASRAVPRRGGGRGPLFPMFKLARVRSALVADGLAELQVRWPSVPTVFCETRPLGKKWTCRFLACRPRMGRRRGRLDRAAHTLGRGSRRDRTRRRAGPATTFHRRSPGRGALPVLPSRPRHAPPGGLGCLRQRTAPEDARHRG
jgi:hypothetical protein